MDPMLLDVPMELATPRLGVRCYRAGDGPALHAAGVRNRRHLARYEGSNVLLGADTEERGEVLARTLHARWVSRDAFFAGAFLRTTGEFVAQVYLGPVDWALPELEIGYIADAAHEGHGFVTEAVTAMLALGFYHLGAHRVRLRTDESNARSHHVAQRCGFVFEGHLRQTHRHPDGSFTGESVYGLLRDEYERHATAGR